MGGSTGGSTSSSPGQWLRPPEDETHTVVRHENDDKLDCQASNLAYGSHSQNGHDRAKNPHRRRRNWRGVTPALKPGNYKLTAEQVLGARHAVLELRRTYASVARELHVSASTVALAVRGITWKNLKAKKAA